MSKPYGGRDTGWPVRVNVRVRRLSPMGKPDNAEAWAVLDAIAATGRVPEGWQVAAVKWQYVKKDGSGGRGESNTAWPDSGTGWREGDLGDLAPLLAPVLEGERLQIGWEKRTRRVEVDGEPWVRYRANGAGGKYKRGQWVPDAYARRYPHLVNEVKGEKKAKSVTVTDYEAEVRVSYDP